MRHNSDDHMHGLREKEQSSRNKYTMNGMFLDFQYMLEPNFVLPMPIPLGEV